MLKTVFFDLGNVLVFFSHAKMCKQISECTGLTPEAVRTILTYENIQELYESGRIDSIAYYQVFKERSPKIFSIRDFLDAASDIFTPNDPLFPLVEQIKAKNLRLILLSNTSECHFNRVYAQYPILRLFDEHILSYEVGALKPSPLIFQKALARAQCDPKCCFYTDDISAFVNGAKKAGLDSEIFTTVPALKGALANRGLLLE
jgi:putative hydrolase of the HAD superfamily